MALGAMAAALSIASAGAAERTFAFDASQLAGEWAESFNTEDACDAKNLHFRLQISPDRTRLNILFDRKRVTASGPTERVSATIVEATPRALVIRYDNEKRILRSGRPMEWQLAIVAPGVYRWRVTDWTEGEVNTVVGIRCSR